MTRLIQVGTNWGEKTLDAASRPDAHARESYFYQVNFQNAVFIGDIRGSDFIQCNLRGADFSKALTYGCVFKGSVTDADTILPDDFGPFQEEFVYEVIRRYIPRLPEHMRPIAEAQIQAHSRGDFAEFTVLGNNVMKSAEDAEEARKLWASMPPKVLKFLRQTIEAYTAEVCAAPPTTTTVLWPDGVKVVLNNNKLPDLPRPDDRYELARWIEAQAGPPTHKSADEDWGRHCWVAAIRPRPYVQTFLDKDGWLGKKRWEY